MPVMICKPGESFQTLLGPQYRDGGEGLVFVDDVHVREARAIGWILKEEAEAASLAHVDAALEQLEAGIADEGEKVEALVEEAMAQVPEERAAEARAEAHAAVLAETEAKDEEPPHEASQAHQAASRDEAQPRGARGDPRNYPTYRPPRR